ncbi:hypothetical protein ACLOJK_039456 [Asimina triloba]
MTISMRRDDYDQIINHGVKACLMEEMLGVVKGFFSLPWEEKVKYASNDVMHPVRYGTSLNTPLAHTRHWRDYLRHYGHPVETTIHLWPHNPTNYREVAKEYLEELWRLLVDLAGVISEGLGLDREHMEMFLGHGFQPIANNYYPPCPEPQLTLGLAAHSDHGFLTILLDNGVQGLQVKHDDRWVTVPRIPGAFIVNAGDCLEMLTNGRYKSVEHRAVVNKESARISIGVGSGPHLDTMVAPLRHLCEEDGGPKFKPVVYGDYVRLQQSITSRGKNALQVALSTPSDS